MDLKEMEICITMLFPEKKVQHVKKKKRTWKVFNMKEDIGGYEIQDVILDFG